MTTTLIRRSDVVRPTTTPLTSTLFDHFPPKDAQHFGLGSDAGLWASYNCLDTLSPTSLCPDPAADSKTFDSAVWQPGFTFAVYTGVQCNAVGLDVADQTSEAKRVFGLNEAKGVEQALMMNRFVATDSDQTDMNGGAQEWADPVDLTPSAEINLVVALALLEGHAAQVYAGLPVIHMPRAAATVLENQGLIVWEGKKAFTKNGSKVVMGGGYDDPNMLASGAWTMYVTGEVYVERSETIEVSTYQRPGDGSGTAGTDNIDENAAVVLVERAYRVAIDCMVAKVTATVFS